DLHRDTDTGFQPRRRVVQRHVHGIVLGIRAPPALAAVGHDADVAQPGPDRLRLADDVDGGADRIDTIDAQLGDLLLVNAADGLHAARVRQADEQLLPAHLRARLDGRVASSPPPARPGCTDVHSSLRLLARTRSA